MDALARQRLAQTSDFSERPAVEFAYKSGARPLDGYTIKRGLGAGGFGEAYYALSDAGKEVALKLVQRHLDIELRGVNQCLNLKHPNLVAIFDVRTNVRGENWIVMEYMAGDSLQQRLDSMRGPMPADEALRWLSGLGAAVDYLHQHGIVHRDLKPGNVFSEDDQIKVGDYGLSKFISTSRRSGQTQSIGTVHYMAPEISTGNYGKSVDVYAAAVIAFEMLSGQLPFDGETTAEILMKHLTAEPELSQVDSKYRSVFERALAKNPPDRFGTVQELCEAIQRAAAGLSPLVAEKPAALIADDKRPKAPPEQAAAAATKSLPTPQPTPRPVRTPSMLASLPPAPGTFAASRRAASDLLWSMFLAGLLSGILSMVALAGEVVLIGAKPDLRGYVSLAALSGLASWGLLGVGRFWDLHRPGLGSRRFHMLLFGMAVGLASLGMDVWLDRDVADKPIASILRTDGWSLETLEELAPPAVAYLSFAALAFAIPDWARGVSRTRIQGFSLWRAVWAGSVAVVLAAIFGMQDPFGFGGVVGVTSIIVQWVSPHEPQLAPRWRRAS